jgi:hypothetical protein
MVLGRYSICGSAPVDASGRWSCTWSIGFAEVGAVRRDRVGEVLGGDVARCVGGQAYLLMCIASSVAPLAGRAIGGKPGLPWLSV